MRFTDQRYIILMTYYICIYSHFIIIKAPVQLSNKMGMEIDA